MSNIWRCVLGSVTKWFSTDNHAAWTPSDNHAAWTPSGIPWFHLEASQKFTTITKLRPGWRQTEKSGVYRKMRVGRGLFASVAVVGVVFYGLGICACKHAERIDRTYVVSKKLKHKVTTKVILFCISRLLFTRKLRESKSIEINAVALPLSDWAVLRCNIQDICRLQNLRLHVIAIWSNSVSAERIAGLTSFRHSSAVPDFMSTSILPW